MGEGETPEQEVEDAGEILEKASTDADDVQGHGLDDDDGDQELCVTSVWCN